MRQTIDDHAATAELTRLRVSPERQGHGVGTGVVEALERRARQDGIRAFALNTGAENERARRFYGTVDFRRAREASVEFEGLPLRLALDHRQF